VIDGVVQRLRKQRASAAARRRCRFTWAGRLAGGSFFRGRRSARTLRWACFRPFLDGLDVFNRRQAVPGPCRKFKHRSCEPFRRPCQTHAWHGPVAAHAAGRLHGLRKRFARRLLELGGTAPETAACPVKTSRPSRGPEASPPRVEQIGRPRKKLPPATDLPK